MSSRCLGALVLLLAALAAAAASAQQILIDRGARVEGLWVFPSAIDPDHYYYVPSTAQLALDEQSQPQFSYLRYVINRPSETPDSQGITEAEGGGILHFLVSYDTPSDVVRKAESALRAKAGEEASLRGPVIFEKGRYALVSSIVDADGEEETHLLASGNAPVLEGSRIALSFDLPAERATLLQESLKMATPDVSLIFEMTLEGLSDAFDADLVVRWDAVRSHESWGVGVDLPLGMIVGPLAAGTGGVGALAYLLPGIGGEAGSLLEELSESQAIELRTRGENPNMEALLDKAVTTILDLLFEPVPAEGEEGGGGLLGQVGDRMSFLEEGKDEFGRPFLPGIGLSAGYRTRRIEKSGETVLSLRSQTAVERVTTIGFNVGDLWSRHGGDPKFFKTVNLADPAFQQREIHVAIDGSILPEFEKYINSVTTTLRKRHQSGATTVREIVVDRETFDRAQNDFRMIYGWNGDEDRDDWLRYEYQTRWSFKGGGVFETGWERSDSNMIDLYAPYRRKVVRVLGDHEALKRQGVRAVIVYVEYPFFDRRRRDKLRVRPTEPITDETLELTLPLEVSEYEYKITWIRSSGERIDREGVDATGLIFVDELPAGGDAQARAAVPPASREPAP